MRFFGVRDTSRDTGEFGYVRAPAGSPANTYLLHRPQTNKSADRPDTAANETPPLTNDIYIPTDLMNLANCAACGHHRRARGGARLRGGLLLASVLAHREGEEANTDECATSHGGEREDFAVQEEIDESGGGDGEDAGDCGKPGASELRALLDRTARGPWRGRPLFPSGGNARARRGREGLERGQRARTREGPEGMDSRGGVAPAADRR